MPKKSRASDVTTVGLVQMSCVPEPEKNLKKAIAGINDAAKRGAQIVCLQELFRSQYFCQTEDIQLFKLAETIPGPTTEALSKVARQKKVVIVASLFEKRTAGVYHNTAVMIDASGKIADRLDGKPAQTHEHSGDEDNPVHHVHRIERVIVRPENKDG
jgi:N-carbamoylputrescine amidase